MRFLRLTGCFLAFGLCASIAFAEEGAEKEHAEGHGHETPLLKVEDEYPIPHGPRVKVLHVDEKNGVRLSFSHPEGPLEWKTDLALWSLVVFGCFVVVLRVMAWGPLMSGLRSRELAVKNDIETARTQRKEAEKALADYQQKLEKAQLEIQALIAEARRDAETTKKDILATAEKETQAMRSRTILEINRARDQAIDELFGHLNQTVAQAVENVLGRSLTGTDQERFVDEAVSAIARR